MKVAVIGAGKMGLPLACVFASRGAIVAAGDANPQTVESINRGICHFDEPGVPELLAEMVKQKQLWATQDNKAAIATSEVVVVIVPVKLTEDRRADLRVIRQIASELAASLQRGAMVCFETTLPVGETRRLGAIIETGGLKAGVDFDLVFSPERVKSQRVMKHLFENPKAVGGVTPRSAERAQKFYAQFLGAPVINLGTLEAAELVKLAGMAYRDVNIALANELAHYAEACGIDFEQVRQAANTDGEAFLLSPGIGVGGHCTPVYPHFLIQDAAARGVELGLVEAGRRLNENQPAQWLAKLGNVAGKRALILGLGFRPQVKEVACSPAFPIKAELEKRGARVALHDPFYTEDEIQGYGFKPGALNDGWEIWVLNTAHEVYRDLDFKRLAVVGLKAVLDGRNLWNPSRVTAAGVVYHGIGRPDEL